MSANRGFSANIGSPNVYEIHNAAGFSTDNESLMSHIKDGIRFYELYNTNIEGPQIRLYDRAKKGVSYTIRISNEDLVKLIDENVSTKLDTYNADKFLEKGFINTAPPPRALAPASSSGAAFTLPTKYNSGFEPNNQNRGAVPNTLGGRRYRKHSRKHSHKRKTAKRSSHKRKSTRKH